MLAYVTGGELALLAMVAAGVGWFLISWALRPVLLLDVSSYDLTTQYGNQRIVERVMLSKHEPIRLRSGANEFYLVIRGGELMQYAPHDLNFMPSLLLEKDETLLFRVQVRVIGKRVVKFDATNLSKPNARLVWSKV